MYVNMSEIHYENDGHNLIRNISGKRYKSNNRILFKQWQILIRNIQMIGYDWMQNKTKQTTQILFNRITNLNKMCL